MVALDAKILGFILRKLRDWFVLIVLVVVAFSVGRSCQRGSVQEIPVLLTKTLPAKVPPADIGLVEKLKGTHEAKVETVYSYPSIEPPVPSERILFLDWDRGRLSFLSDSAREYIYRLPKSTFQFSVRPRNPGFMVKYRRPLWDRRLVLGGLYPLDAFAQLDITFRERLFLQGEITTKDWRVGVGWRIF